MFMNCQFVNLVITDRWHRSHSTLLHMWNFSLFILTIIVIYKQWSYIHKLLHSHWFQLNVSFTFIFLCCRFNSYYYCDWAVIHYTRSSVLYYCQWFNPIGFIEIFWMNNCKINSSVRYIQFSWFLYSNWQTRKYVNLLEK